MGKGKRKSWERVRAQAGNSYKKRLTDIVGSAIKMVLERIKRHSELNLAHREQLEGFGAHLPLLSWWWCGHSHRDSHSRAGSQALQG